MNSDIIKLAQSELNRLFHANIALDGIAGTNTKVALHKVTVLPTEWNTQRKIIGLIQYVATLEDIDSGPIDGKWGPQTQSGYADLVYKREHGRLPEPWRQEEFTGSSEGQWPLQNEAFMEKLVLIKAKQILLTP